MAVDLVVVLTPRRPALAPSFGAFERGRDLGAASLSLVQALKAVDHTKDGYMAQIGVSSDGVWSYLRSHHRSVLHQRWIRRMTTELQLARRPTSRPRWSNGGVLRCCGWCEEKRLQALWRSS